MVIFAVSTIWAQLDTAADTDGGNGAPISESACCERFQLTGRIGVRRSGGSAKLRLGDMFMMDNENPYLWRSSWPVGAVVILLWLTTPSPLMAEIQDIRKAIAQQSVRYRAEHFPDGRMPPKHDWSNQRPLRRGAEMSPEAPGGVGYGYYFYNNALLWTNSTVADYYVVAPTFPGQNIAGSYLYLTSTCRAQLGTESLIEYDGTHQAAFWIYDWARPAANRWQVMMDLPTYNPQYLTMRPDEFAVTRQMVHVRNGTAYLGFAGGQHQWRNQVMLFNFNRGDWDLIYSYNYGTANLTDNLYGSGGNPTGFWGPIVETFETYTNINPVGFDLIRLFQDGNQDAHWLNTTNSYALMSSSWQLLAAASNTSFTAAVSSTNLGRNTNSLGALCVTAGTNAASFSLSPQTGIVSSTWVATPMSNLWDEIVVGLPPGSYAITFNPVPGLVAPARQNFTIVANGITPVQAVYDVQPGFQSVTAAGGSIVFSWNATTGLVYQLQYKTNLNQADWVNLGGAITASNTILSATNAFGSDSQRFYRVQQQ